MPGAGRFLRFLSFFRFHWCPAHPAHCLPVPCPSPCPCSLLHLSHAQCLFLDCSALLSDPLLTSLRCLSGSPCSPVSNTLGGSLTQLRGVPVSFVPGSSREVHRIGSSWHWQFSVFSFFPSCRRQASEGDGLREKSLS